MYKLRSFFLLPLLLTACSTQTVVPKPGAITLEEAMKSVAAGLVEMKAAEVGMKTGLIPSEVTVTFNISATATDQNKLVVEVGAPAGAPVGGKIGGEAGSSATSQRGNQVTVKFSNILFAPDNTLLKYKTAEEIKELFDVLEKSGIQVYLMRKKNN